MLISGLMLGDVGVILMVGCFFGLLLLHKVTLWQYSFAHCSHINRNIKGIATTVEQTVIIIIIIINHMENILLYSLSIHFGVVMKWTIGTLVIEGLE